MAVKIEMGKKYQTRDGRKVEITTTTRDHFMYPVLAKVDCGGEWLGESYTSDGYYAGSKAENHNDLIEVKKVRTFVNPDYKDPTLISMDKKYRTRDGRDVRVLMVDLKNAQYPVACVVAILSGQETVMIFTDNGHRFSDGSRAALDLIEIPPFDDLKIDDPVLITAGSSGSVGRVFHFAGTIEDGRPKVWAQGRTSLTVKNKVCDWWTPAGLEPYVAE